MDLIRTETPESVALIHTPAGLGSRLAAALIDGLIQAAAALGFFLLGIMTAAIGEEVGLKVAESVILALLLLLGVVVILGYPLFFETVWQGQTPGKRAMGLRVTRSDGLPADFSRLAVRNLLRLVDFLPAFYAAGTFGILLSRHGQRLGDLAAGTVVIRELPAVLPNLPTQLAGPLTTPAATLRRQLTALPDTALEPVRAFWTRRDQLAPVVRPQIAERLAGAVAAACGWTEPIADPERFLEEVLVIRHGTPQPPGPHPS